MKLLRHTSVIRVNPLTHEVQVSTVSSQVRQGLAQASQVRLLKGTAPSRVPASRGTNPISQAMQKLALRQKAQLLGQATQVLSVPR